jgi:hypothetical protein
MACASPVRSLGQHARLGRRVARHQHGHTADGGAFQETGAPTLTSPNGSTIFSGSTGSTGSTDSTDSTTSDPTTSDPTSTCGSVSGFVATNYSQYLNQNVETGPCVALVRAADSSVGLTGTLTQGSAVQGNTALQPGTVIATFGSNGTISRCKWLLQKEDKPEHVCGI